MTYPKLEKVTTYTWVVGILCGVFCGVIGMLFVVFVVQVKHASEWFSKSFPRKLSYGLLISCISAVIALFFPMTLFWSENEFPYLVRTCLHSNSVRPLSHAPLPGPFTVHASHQRPPPPPPPLPLNMFHCRCSAASTRKTAAASTLAHRHASRATPPAPSRTCPSSSYSTASLSPTLHTGLHSPPPLPRVSLLRARHAPLSPLMPSPPLSFLCCSPLLRLQVKDTFSPGNLVGALHSLRLGRVGCCSCCSLSCDNAALA